MRVLLVALFVIFPWVSLHGYTDAEYLDIARELIRHSRPMMSDNLMQGWASIGFEGFASTNAFFGMSVDGLTASPPDRQAAFDFYLNQMATTNDPSLRKPEDREFSMLAVEQCVRMNYTNEIAALRRFVVGTEVVKRHLAIASVIQLGGLENESLDFVLQIGTNGVAFSQRERNAAWRELSRCVKARRDANTLTGLQRERIAHLIYGLHLSDWPGAVSVDEILCECNENYGASSNRYDTICRVLACPGLPERLNEYFSNITNRLTNAMQPLPAVEGL